MTTTINEDRVCSKGQSLIEDIRVCPKAQFLNEEIRVCPNLKNGQSLIEEMSDIKIHSERNYYFLGLHITFFNSL